MAVDRVNTITLKANVADFRAGMRQSADAVRNFGTQAGRSADGAGRSVGRLRQQSDRGATSLADYAKKGLALGAGLGIAQQGVQGLTEFIGGSISAASDLNETLNKSSVIFGNNARDIEAWGSTAAENLGLSKEQAIGAAASFGDMFTQLGFTGDEAAKSSKQVVQLSADLGSFNNLDTADVADRMSAAFRGEYDSLQAVIPNINAARVETEALAASGKTNASQLTAQEKAQAVLSIVQKDGARAAGDFARTSDGLANSQKILAARVADSQAAIGQMLLPAVTLITQGLGSLAGIVGSGVQAFNDLPGPIKAAAVAFVALRLAAGPIGSLSAQIGPHVRSMADSIRLAGMYASDAGGGFRGASAGFRALTGGAGPARAAMGGLRAAGSGLFGAMGGPWGVALMGGVVALSAWSNAAAESDARTKEFGDTLDKTTGKATDMSAAFIKSQIKSIVTPEALDTMLKAGFDYDTFTRDLAAGGDRATSALARYKEALDQAGIKTEAFGQAVGSYADISDLYYDNIQPAIDGQGRLNQMSSAGTTVTNALAGAFKDLAPTMATAKNEADATNKKLAEQKQAALDAAKGVLSLRDAHMGARGSARDFEASLDAVTASIKENGKSLDINTAQGRANQAALDGVAESGVKHVEALIKEGRSTKEVTAAMASHREAFIKSADQYGISRTEAAKLANQLGLTDATTKALTATTERVPASVTTTVKQPGMATARDNTRRLGGELESLPGSKSIHVNATVAGLAAVRALKASLNSLAGVNVGVNIPGNKDGGAIYGPGGPRDDMVPRRLSNGEHVLTAADVAALGGQHAVYQWRAALHSSDAGFAVGGAGGHPYALRAAHVSSYSTARAGTVSLDASDRALLLKVAAASDRPVQVHTSVGLDGREIAWSVTKHQSEAAAMGGTLTEVT